ncbi:hypothetical protein Tco_0566301 [Tanacetum coccineum]
MSSGSMQGGKALEEEPDEVILDKFGQSMSSMECKMHVWRYFQSSGNTMKYDEKTGVYWCHVHEQWLIKESNCFPDQPVLRRKDIWQVTNPVHPVLQMLWGMSQKLTLIMQNLFVGKNFTQGIQTFFSHKAVYKDDNLLFGESPAKYIEDSESPCHSSGDDL